MRVHSNVMALVVAPKIDKSAWILLVANAQVAALFAPKFKQT